MPPESRGPGDLIRDAEGPLLYWTYGLARLHDLKRHIIGPLGYGLIVSKYDRGMLTGIDVTVTDRDVRHVNASRAA